MAAESDASPVLRAVLIVVAMLALYVLSIRPVYHYGVVSNGLPEWVIDAYGPLRWAAARSETVDEVLKWYIGHPGEE